MSLLNRDYQYAPLQMQQPTAAPAQKRKKNFWLDQISTVGGIAGGIGGSFIAPVVGTAGGAALGSGLGEAIENAISGQRIMDNVGKESLIGGVLGGGPLRLGKAALGARSALQAGTATGIGSALKMGGQAAASSSIRKAVGEKTLESGTKAVAKQFKLTPSQLFNFKKRTGEDAINVIKRYGIGSADDVATKGIQPLQGAFDEVITQIPAVSKSELQRGLKSVYQPLLKSAVLPEQQLGRQLQSQADEILKQAGNKVDPAVVNGLRKQFDSFVTYTTRGTAEHNATKMTADALRKTLQTAADKAGIGWQGKTFKEIGKDLNKLYGLDEIVGRQAELGRGASPLGLSTLMGGAAGGGMAGPVGSIAGMAATTAINSPMGRRLAAKGFEATGNKLIGSGTASAARAATPRGIATRLGAVGALKGGFPQDMGSTQPSLEEALLQASPNQTDQAYMPNATNNAMNPNMQQSYQTDGQMSSDTMTQQNPYPRENLIADIQRDPQNAKDYIAYYEALDAIFNPEPEDPVKQTETQRARDEAAALADDAFTQLQGGSISTGPIGPKIENLKAIVNKGDPETLQFNTTISALMASIAKARAGTSFTPNEQKLLNQYAPKVGDSEQTLYTKLQALRQVFGQAQQREQGVQYAPDLQTAVMQTQGAY